MGYKHVFFPDDKARAALTGSDQDNIATIARNIHNKNCVLFLGAGSNACPDEYRHLHQDAEQPPNGRALSQLLIKDMGKSAIFGEPYDSDLSKVSEYFQLHHGDRLYLHNRLISHVKTGKMPTQLLKLIADMPFEYIMTTNYDQLLEQAMAALKPAKKPHVGVYQRASNAKTRDPGLIVDELHPYIFKIHGDIDNQESIVITEEDYIHFLMRMRDKESYYPVPQLFTKALATKSILFIGYRLMDFNLRLLFKTLRWGKDPMTLPRNYSVDPFPDMHTKNLITSYYSTVFLVQNAWTILPLIQDELLKLTQDETA